MSCCTKGRTRMKRTVVVSARLAISALGRQRQLALSSESGRSRDRRHVVCRPLFGGRPVRNLRHVIGDLVQFDRKVGVQVGPVERL